MPTRTRGPWFVRVATVLVFAHAIAPLVAQQTSLGASGDLTAAEFTRQIGRRISYVCPPTQASSDAVWGTDVYTFDSVVCVAAIHAGVLQPQRIGVVTFTMGPGAAAFTGSTRNGVTSQSFTAYESTFRFDTSGQPGRIDGGTTLNVPTGFTRPLVVVCPPIGDFPYEIYGTDVYADESSICAAAVHAGITTAAAGGPVSVIPGGAQSAFQGSVRNGVTTQGYTEWPTSFRVAAVQQTTAQTSTPATAILANPVAAAPTATTILSAPAPATLPANAGRYRVILLGASVRLPSKDIPDNADGIGDEIFGAAITMLWDRRTNTIANRDSVRTREYGDLNAIRKAEDRIRAGNGGRNGGIIGLNVVPDGFVAGQLLEEPHGDRFPLLVWEGVLTEGIDGLLVVPSLWEADATGFVDYERRWTLDEPSQTLTSVLPQVPLPGLSVITATIAPGPTTALSLAEIPLNVIHRPLGLTAQPFVAPYRDRFIVVTREKLAALTAVGSTTHLAINYAEPPGDPVLGADYTLSLRIERMQ